MAVTLNQVARDLVRVQFSGKDWDTYVAEINTFLEDAFGTELYNNFVATDVGQMMIEAVAYGLSTLSWFADRQAGENFIETAEIPANVARLVRLVGYKPRGAVPSSGEVEITLGAAQVFDVDVEQGTQVVGEGGIIYETNAKITFLAGEIGPKAVGVTEGSEKEELFVSNGLANQTFYLRGVPDGQYIAEGSVQTFVASVEWPVVDFLTFEKTNQSEASITQDPPLVRFGDGIAGNIPPSGAEIKFVYRTVYGAAGQAQANTIITFRLPILANFTVIPATVTNPEPTGVGSDPESISESKTRAPQLYRTADRAVTDDDYTSLVEAFVDPLYGAVAVGRAVISRSVDEDAETKTILLLLTSQYGAMAPDLLSQLTSHWDSTLSSTCKANLVSVQILQRDASGRLVSPNLGLAQAVKTYLEARKEVTQTVSVTDGSANLYRVDTATSVKVLSGYSSPGVLASVKAAIDAHLTAKRFGDSVYKSQLDQVVMELDGVDYLNLTFTVRDFSGTPVPGKVDSNGNVVVENYEVVTLGVTADPVLIL